MSKPVHEESPLVGQQQQMFLAALAGKAVRVQLFERAFLGHINLRGDPGSSAFLDAVRQKLGCAPPLQPNSFVDAGVVRVCWLGPNEWLVMCPGPLQGSIAEQLCIALKGQFAAVTEIGSGQTVLGASGPRARDVIAKGCPLDLHPRVFQPGCCAQTILAHAGITILQASAAPCFELIVRRSFADYVWRWLADAATEYDYASVEPTPWLEGSACESAPRPVFVKAEA